jgi:hypothetical protein
LLTGSGLLFGLCGFMHAAVALAMLIIVGGALFLDQALRGKLFFPAFMCVSIFLWGTYLAKLGLHNFLVPPAGHDASLRYLLFRTAIIISFYAEVTLVYFAALILLGYERRNLAYLILISLATLYYGANLADYLFDLPTMPPFPMHGIFFLSKEGQGMSRLLGSLAYFLLLFSALLWLTEVVGAAAWQPGISMRQRANITVTRVMDKLYGDVQSRKWIMAICGFALLQAATAVGSDTGISQGMIFFAGAVLGFSILMLSKTQASSRAFMPFALVWIGFCAAFTLAYNHPTQQSILARNRIALNFSPLKGLRETPRYNASIRKLLSAYRAGDCQSTPLIMLIYTPILYYVFGHPIPEGVGVLRPAFYYPEDKIRAVLNPDRGWCVVDATEAEIARNIAATGYDKREPLRRWLIARSDRTVAIQSPSPAYISDIKLYIRRGKSP